MAGKPSSSGDHRAELVKSSGPFVREMKLVWALLNDPDVSGKIKFLWWAVVLIYLISPAGIPEDFVTGGLGVLDDILVISIASAIFQELCPKEVVAKHRAEIFGAPTASQQSSARDDADTVDGEFREVRD